MKVRKIILAISFCFIGCGLFFNFFYNEKNVDESLKINSINDDSRDSYKINFTEVQFSAEQLIDRSDNVVVGKFTSKLEDYDYADYYKGDDLPEGTKLLCSLYQLEISDVLKGDDIKSARVSFGGNELPESLEYDKEYVICLEKSVDMDEDVYCASINQGIFVEENSNLKCNTGNKYKKKDFKNKIEEVKEKNRKGIKIKQPYELSSLEGSNTN